VVVSDPRTSLRSDVLTRRWRCLHLREVVAAIVHDDATQIDVAADGVDEAARTDRVPVTVSDHEIQVWVCQLRADTDSETATVVAVERVAVYVAAGLPRALDTGDDERVSGPLPVFASALITPLVSRNHRNRDTRWAACRS
jgi:hypothetical protein